MKKNIYTIILLALSIIFIILQFAYSQLKFKTGVYNTNIRYAEYIVIALLMLTTLIFVKKEGDKKAFLNLIIMYVILGVAFALFIARGAIK